MVTTDSDSQPVKNGVVSFSALPGPLVMVLLSNGIPGSTVRLLVPDKANATLRECIEAVGLADDGELSELEELSLEVARVAAQIASADRLEVWASETASAAGQAQISKTEANSAANRAGVHESNTKQAEANAKQAELNAKQSETNSKKSENSAEAAAGEAASTASKARAEFQDIAIYAASAAEQAGVSEENARAHEAKSLSAAERAELAAEETVQQIEGNFATRTYVDTSLEDVGNLVTQNNQSLDNLRGRVNDLEPQSVDEVEETIWAHVTPEGERLPLGYSQDGRLDSHAQKILQEDIVDTFDVSHSPVYARLSTTPKGDILWGVRWDGTVEIPKLESNTGGGSGSSLATRLVPLAFTLPGGSSTTSGAKSLRIIREYAHFPGRVRVHVSNRHPMSGNAGSDVTLTGSTIGVGAESGAVSKTQVLFSANTVIPAGEEVVSRWVTLSGSDGDGVAISLAWSGDTVRLFKGGCWTNSDPATFSNANTSGWVWNSDSPLYIWVEAEMPARIPVVMVNGDSISVGSVTDNPVSDAWLAMYAREHNALPVFASWHGSSMPQWAPDTGQWGRLYPGVNIRPDAIVMALGQNDLNQDVDLNELKSRYNTVRDVYDARFPGVPVYVGTVNASNKPAEKEVIRKQFNTWLSGLPRGERGALDFASVLDDLTGEFLLPEYTADELHPNTAGQTAMAGVALETPISPYVLTAAQMAQPVDATLLPRADNTVGNRVFVGDTMIYGNTGVRNITGLIDGDQGTGTARIQRVGNTVMLSLVNIPTPGTGTYMSIPNFIPQGFRSSFNWQYLGIGKASSIDAAGPLRVGTNGDLFIYRTSSETRVNGTIAYTSETPWPTSLPGTPA